MQEALMEQRMFVDFDGNPEEPAFVRFGMTFSADEVWSLKHRLTASAPAAPTAGAHAIVQGA